jgi:hypothetical protein
MAVSLDDLEMRAKFPRVDSESATAFTAGMANLDFERLLSDLNMLFFTKPNLESGNKKAALIQSAGCGAKHQLSRRCAVV